MTDVKNSPLISHQDVLYNQQDLDYSVDEKPSDESNLNNTYNGVDIDDDEQIKQQEQDQLPKFTGIGTSDEEEDDGDLIHGLAEAASPINDNFAKSPLPSPKSPEKEDEEKVANIEETNIPDGLRSPIENETAIDFSANDMDILRETIQNGESNAVPTEDTNLDKNSEEMIPFDEEELESNTPPNVLPVQYPNTKLNDSEEEPVASPKRPKLETKKLSFSPEFNQHTTPKKLKKPDIEPEVPFSEDDEDQDTITARLDHMRNNSSEKQPDALDKALAKSSAKKRDPRQKQKRPAQDGPKSLSSVTPKPGQKRKPSSSQKSSARKKEPEDPHIAKLKVIAYKFWEKIKDPKNWKRYEATRFLKDFWRELSNESFYCNATKLAKCTESFIKKSLF